MNKPDSPTTWKTRFCSVAMKIIINCQKEKKAKYCKLNLINVRDNVDSLQENKKNMNAKIYHTRIKIQKYWMRYWRIILTWQLNEKFWPSPSVSIAQSVLTLYLQEGMPTLSRPGTADYANLSWLPFGTCYAGISSWQGHATKLKTLVTTQICKIAVDS